MMLKFFVALCLLTAVCVADETLELGFYEFVAKQRPGVADAKASDDGLHLRIALQRSSNGDNTAIANAISVLVWDYSKDNRTGVFQIGLVNNQNRVTTMWEVGSFAAKANYNNTTWLTQIIQNPIIFDDDTRNYDPYGNRYTPIQTGQGVIGSLVMPWLYGN